MALPEQPTLNGNVVDASGIRVSHSCEILISNRKNGL